MLLIKNGYVMDPKSQGEGIKDILIEDNKVIAIGNNLPVNMLLVNYPQVSMKELEIIDATGLVVAPGLVDVHVHFRDPGFTYKEDIETGAKAAAKGGYTTVVLMANTKPAVDNLETLNYILEKGASTNIHVKTCCTVTQGMLGKELSSMEELKDHGASGFTDDGIPIMDEALVREAMIRTRRLGVPISFHEENPALIENNGINKGRASEFYKIGGSPREAEIDFIKRDLEIALETDAIINIQHISSKEAVELVRIAKKRSNNIHCEASPHHFTLTEESLIEKGTLAKMNPPLRTQEDRLAIIEGLKDGTIDLIATDHAPHSKEEKERSILDAPSGIIGLETALSLGITELVAKGYLSMMELIKKMSYNPSNMYGFDCGRIEKGCTADFVIFNEKETWTVESFISKSANSPFLGETLNGVVMYTICDGKIIYQNKVAKEEELKSGTDEKSECSGISTNRESI